MATKEQKFTALAQAVDIAKDYGKGGTSRNPESVLEKFYEKIIEITDKIEKN